MALAAGQAGRLASPPPPYALGRLPLFLLLVVHEADAAELTDPLPLFNTMTSEGIHFNQAKTTVASCHRLYLNAVAGRGCRCWVRAALESQGTGRLRRITDVSHVQRHEGLWRLLRVVPLRVVCGSGTMLLAD